MKIKDTLKAPHAHTPYINLIYVRVKNTTQTPNFIFYWLFSTAHLLLSSTVCHTCNHQMQKNTSQWEDMPQEEVRKRGKMRDAWITTLGSALESWRWSLATVDEDLKGNGDDDIDIQKLGLDGGAQADGGVQVHKPLQHRTACVLGTAADPDVHKPS